MLDEGRPAHGSERALRPGDRVLVYGTLVRGDAYRGDATPVLRGEPGHRLRVTRKTQEEIRERRPPVVSTVVAVALLGLAVYFLTKIKQ